MKSAGLVTTTLGALVAAGGFVLWLRTPSAPKTASDQTRPNAVASAHLVPVVSVNYGGVGLSAEF